MSCPPIPGRLFSRQIEIGQTDRWHYNIFSYMIIKLFGIFLKVLNP